MARPRREESVSKSVVIRLSDSELLKVKEIQGLGYWNSRSEFIRDAIEHYIFHLKNNELKK